MRSFAILTDFSIKRTYCLGCLAVTDCVHCEVQTGVFLSVIIEIPALNRADPVSFQSAGPR
jgi:hypothetical protein